MSVLCVILLPFYAALFGAQFELDAIQQGEKWEVACLNFDYVQ